MSGCVLRVLGPLASLSDRDRAALLDRSTSSDTTVRERTAEIIRRVRRDGDAALLDLARELDGVSLSGLEVPRSRWNQALDTLDPALRRAMERTVANVSAVHRAFLPTAHETSPEPGIVIGRRPDPLRRVGVYAPGGRAAYPSSVIMGAAPARVAGVDEIVLCSPPQLESGVPSAVVLAAAALVGVDRVFAVGGAGAVGAMAYGTESIPQVDRIVGPGNAYVAEAKLQVSGAVAIDAPAGPSELLIIADSEADERTVARELVAQAEHDPLACVVAIVIGETLAAKVKVVLDVVARETPRAPIVERALADHGAVLWCDTVAQAIEFANAYAAEHVLVVGAEEMEAAALDALRSAGTIFVGASASVAFGDYMTGANHVLPTGGLARSYSGLSTLDFFRWTTYQRVSRDAATRLSSDVAIFADAEGLPAHAAAARAWGQAAPVVAP